MPKTAELLARIDERTQIIKEDVSEIKEHLKETDKVLLKHAGKLGKLNGKVWGIIAIISASGGGGGIYALTKLLG